jgi:hypothetical protein
MTEGNYSNLGHRGPVYKGLDAMNPCDLSKSRKVRRVIAIVEKRDVKLWNVVQLFQDRDQRGVLVDKMVKGRG